MEATTTDRQRGVQILAKTLYRDLISQGYAASDIVALATQLLAQLTERKDTTPPHRD